MSSRQPVSVLLATEGTYPFYTGGVSTWCHRLISQLPQLSFKIYGVVTNPYSQMKYELPPNVREVQKVPLWGTMQPAEYSSHSSFSQHLKILGDTTPEAIAQRFLPLWEGLLYGILSDQADLHELAGTLLAMNRYFQQFSYQRTWASPMVWTAFKNAITAAFDSRPPGTQDPTVAEMKQVFRLLYHFLTVLYFPVPSADITHSSAAGFCGIPCILAKLEHGTPFLLTEHGVYLREQYLNLRRQVKSFFVRWLLYRTVTAIVRLNYHFADQVSPVCAYNSRWERELGTPAERIRVIFNGADPSRFLPREPQPKQRPLVVNVGLIYALKGQLDLIEAAALVRENIPDVEFRLYGSASDNSYHAQCLDKIRQLGLERTVFFAGVTQQPWQVYSDADVVAFASISEGFPYVVVEAMLCGAAVISTDVGGVREALADTGLLVRPRSPQELAQAIRFLLEAPEERKRLGEQARIRALAHFTEEEFLANYLRTYHELCSRRPRPLIMD